MREVTVEQWLRRYVEASGGRCVKVGTGGLPDRACVWPNRPVEWVELKQPTGRLMRRQRYRVKQLEREGYAVSVLWTVEAVREWARERLGIAQLPAEGARVRVGEQALYALDGAGPGQDGDRADDDQ